MNKQIHRSIQEPIRKNMSWADRWLGDDKGLITCWEVGREKRQQDPQLAKRAERGELPYLGWKGGVKKKLKNPKKYGTLFYFAQWQGLRGEDLDVDLSKEYDLICPTIGMTVTYTNDPRKYAQ